MLFFFSTERTEKVPMGSIKNVVSEPIEGHEDYHMMVTVRSWSRSLACSISDRTGAFLLLN